MIYMWHSRIEGTYYEMGCKYGTGLKKSGFRLPHLEKSTLLLGLRCKEKVTVFFPEILEEIQGIAEAGGFDFEKLAAFIFSLGSKASGCSVFAVRSSSSVYLCRNYDNLYWLKKVSESYLTIPEKSYASLGHSDIFVGRADGINEKGLGVAVSGEEVCFEPGIPIVIAVRYILDKCATVREGVEFLNEIPHFTTQSYLLADKGGDMSVVEASPKRTVERSSKDDFLISTNHFVHSDMAEFNLDIPNSRIRYGYINKILCEHRGKVDESLLMAILSSHEGQVCAHIDDEKLGTLWSIIANLKTLHIFRAEGRPCRAEYSVDSRLNKAIRKRQEHSNLKN